MPDDFAAAHAEIQRLQKRHRTMCVLTVVAGALLVMSCLGSGGLGFWAFFSIANAEDARRQLVHERMRAEQHQAQLRQQIAQREAERMADDAKKIEFRQLTARLAEELVQKERLQREVEVLKAKLKP